MKKGTKMRNLITKLAVVSSLVLSSSWAEAIENDYKPYIGADYAYVSTTAKGLHSNNNSVRAVLGSVYNPYFGTEIFYQYAGKDKHKFREINASSFNAYGLDMLTYLPLGNSGIAPLATAGLGYYSVKHRLADHSHNNDYGWGYRFGGGVQYDFNDNWALRGIVRYIKTDKINRYDHLTEYVMGLRYTFD